MPWQFLLLILVAIVLYIVADAFFDISRKISAKLSPLKSLGGALGSAAKLVGTNPLVALLAVVGLPALVFGVVSYVEDRGAQRERLKTERANTEVAEFERDSAIKAAGLAEDTHRDRARVVTVVEQAEQDISDAVEQADFDALWSTYDRAYRGVWNDAERADSPNPNERGPEDVRSAGADSA